MHTGIIGLPVCLLWLIAHKSPYAYGDHADPQMHTGTFINPVCIRGSFHHSSSYAYGDRDESTYAYRDLSNPNMHTGFELYQSPYVNRHNGSPRMRTGMFKIPVRVLWLIGHESLYAYGDSTDPATHTGIYQSLTVCIMYSCAYGKLGIRPPYAKVCI
jgi:hypothetical protein